MKVTTVSPDAPGYRDVNRTMKERIGGRVDYGTLAKRYNEAEVDAILLVDIHHNLRLANIARVLERRGLDRGMDYTITRPKKDANGVTIPPHLRPVAIKKLSPQQMITTFSTG